MGKRDFGGRETKKQRKDAKKPLATNIIAPPPTPQAVEVIKKRRKQEGEETAD